MSFEAFIDLVKYLWIPLFGFAYKTYSHAQEKQDDEISKLKEKVSQQMTKIDVTEVVDNAVEKLSLKIEKDLLKIDNGVHHIKNQFASKDSTLIELNHVMTGMLEFMKNEKK